MRDFIANILENMSTWISTATIDLAEFDYAYAAPGYYEQQDAFYEWNCDQWDISDFLHYLSGSLRESWTEAFLFLKDHMSVKPENLSMDLAELKDLVNTYRKQD